MTPRLRALLPDASDVLVVAGILLTTLGIARLSVPWAMIIAGTIVTSLGLAIVVRRTR